jgi:hypothetical protein
MKEEINLIYWKSDCQNGNFGDELSKFIISKLINKEKYELLINSTNKKNVIDIIAIGSIMHLAKTGSYVFGSGVRTPSSIKKIKKKKLKILAVRGL